MKADVQYNDFIGTAAADISDFLGTRFGDDIESFGKYFSIDQNKFTVIGISIYGTENLYINLYCIDKDRSDESNKYVVKMSVPISEEDQKEILNILFKRLEIVLHSKFDNQFKNLDYNEEVDFSDFHEENED